MFDYIWMFPELNKVIFNFLQLKFSRPNFLGDICQEFIFDS